jgi:hypothetical protein
MNSILDVSAVLKNTTPGYVPPVSWEKLGRIAFQQNLTPELSWPATMRKGYRRALFVAADAETSAYLVSQGQGGELS